MIMSVVLLLLIRCHSSNPRPALPYSCSFAIPYNTQLESNKMVCRRVSVEELRLADVCTHTDMRAMERDQMNCRQMAV